MSVISNISRLLLTKFYRGKYFKRFGLEKATEMSFLHTSSESSREGLYAYRISAIEKVTPYIKKIVLSKTVRSPSFTFRAGQWLDLYAPGIPKCGGFSIWSSPLELKTEGTIKLAVKYSDEEPAKWIHSQNCVVGVEVDIKPGGEFVFDPQPIEPITDLIFFGGGVGMNPLVSMCLHALDLRKEFIISKIGYNPGSISVLYSAKTMADLIHINVLKRWENNYANGKCSFYATKETANDHQLNVRLGRITPEDIRAALKDKSNPTAYVCGPQPFMDFVITELKNNGLDSASIKIEDWSSDTI